MVVGICYYYYGGYCYYYYWGGCILSYCYNWAYYCYYIWFIYWEDCWIICFSMPSICCMYEEICYCWFALLFLRSSSRLPAHIEKSFVTSPVTTSCIFQVISLSIKPFKWFYWDGSSKKSISWGRIGKILDSAPGLDPGFEGASCGFFCSFATSTSFFFINSDYTGATEGFGTTAGTVLEAVLTNLADISFSFISCSLIFSSNSLTRSFSNFSSSSFSFILPFSISIWCSFSSSFCFWISRSNS